MIWKDSIYLERKISITNYKKNIRNLMFTLDLGGGGGIDD